VSTVHLSTCPLCEAMCGIKVEVEQGAIQSIRPDKEDPFSQGHICPKAAALKDLREDPDRLRRPLKRTAGGWQEVEWERALDEVADRLSEVMKRHGERSVGIYQGNPTVHSYTAVLYGQFLTTAMGSAKHFSATSLDQLPHMLAAYQMFGHQLLLPVPDLDRCDYLLMLGANPLVSNGSLMTAGCAEKRLRALRARGGRWLVVDPRRTRSAEAADEHIAIRPGSDAAFLLALVAVLFEEDRVALGRLGDHCDGLDELRAVALRFSPERVEPVTGISADTVRRIARELSDAEAGCVYGRMGVSTQPFGGLCGWLLNVLNLLTGNLDRPGGLMFCTPAVDLVRLGSTMGRRGSFGRYHSRKRKLPEFSGELPAVTLVEEMEEPGEGQLRALVTAAGNPVLSAPGGPRLDKAMAGLDFMVSVDFYLNETTRHADYILPPTAALERDHYDLVFNALAVRNVAKFAPAVFERPADARHDWEILGGLAHRLMKRRGGRSRWASALLWGLMCLKPRRLLDWSLRLGPYRRGHGTNAGGMSLRELEKHPHGIDLGPLEPRLPGALGTPNGRIPLAARLYLDDVERLDAWVTEHAKGGSESLVLIGRRHLRSNNSWMHNLRSMVKGAMRCTLLMHPDDAKSRQLSTGEEAVVATGEGRVTVPVEISDEMRPGVVSLPHGWGHNRPGIKLSVASERPGVSLNDLLEISDVDELTGVAVLNGSAVTVRRAG